MAATQSTARVWMLNVLLICLPSFSAAAVYAHVGADGSIAEAPRMMRLEETSLQQGEASKEHLVSIGSHGSRADMETKLADDARAGVGSFVECSVEGGTCKCDGVVMYGRPTSNWEELRADGSVPCTAAMFDSIPAPEGELNVCRCYSLHWCGENNVDKLVSDTASRRRNSFGVPGRNLHQWRRWCGWGPRDCAWSSWSKWSECSGGKQCAEEGVSQRTRQQETEPENGGRCQPESTSEETKCHWVGCQKDQSSLAKLKMSKAFAAEEAEGVLAKSAEAVKKAAEAAGVSSDLVSRARSKFQTMARAEAGSLTPARLGRIAAEAFLPAVRTVIASSDVRANVVSLAGEVILLGVQDESPLMAHVVDVMASEIADALGLPSIKTSTSAPDSGVQVFGTAGSTTTVPTIAIFPKDGSDSLQG